jgi:hypothetical protein
MCLLYLNPQKARLSVAFMFFNDSDRNKGPVDVFPAFTFFYDLDRTKGHMDVFPYF